MLFWMLSWLVVVMLLPLCTWGALSISPGQQITVVTALPASPRPNQLIILTTDGVAHTCVDDSGTDWTLCAWDAAGEAWIGLGGVAGAGSTPTLDQVVTAGASTDNAVDLASAIKLGGSTKKVHIYQDGAGALRIRACDTDGTNCVTFGVRAEAGSHWLFTNEDGDVCLTINSNTGALTQAETNDCDPNIVTEDNTATLSNKTLSSPVWSGTATGTASLNLTGDLTMSGGITSNVIEVTDDDSNPSCGAGEYKVYADTSEAKWKKCQNGAASDLDTSGGTDTDTVSYFFGCDDVDTVLGNDTNWLYRWGSTTLACGGNSNAPRFRGRVGFNGTVRGLVCEIEVSPDNSGSEATITFTVVINDLDTDAACTITGTSTGPCSDMAGTTAVTAADEITVKSATNNGTGVRDTGSAICDVFLQK